MADYGHEWTDKRLAVMEKKIAKIYAETLEEAQTRLNEIISTFAEEDKKRADMVKAGTLTQKKYVAWRQETLGKKKHLMDMIDTLADDFSNADRIAMKIVSGEALDVYALNANFAAYDIERGTGMNLSWTLYDHSTVERILRDDPDLLPLPSVDIPLDKRWNKQHINAAITKGLLLGDPIDEIAKRLVTVASMDYNAAVRSARTATTAAECAGRIDTYKQAAAMGIQLKQMWRATLDGRTRHAHRLLDGQMVDIGEKFKVDGYELEYPGDPSAPGYLVYNCRCTVVSVDKFHDPNAPRASKLGDLSYEEWKAGKEIKDTNKWQTITDYSQNSGTIKENILSTPIKSSESHYKQLLDDLEMTSLNGNLDYNPVKMQKAELAEDEIITALAGGDKTMGSCASLGLAYIGQKQGWDVLDFRDGESRWFFSSARNLRVLSEADGIKTFRADGASSMTVGNRLLKMCENGKEYYLSVGRHAAIVRKTNEGVLQYLELQSSIKSGWTNFNGNPRYTLKTRFGCTQTSGPAAYYDFMIDIADSNFNTDDFKSLMGYINTAADKQRKGSSGTIK